MKMEEKTAQKVSPESQAWSIMGIPWEEKVLGQGPGHSGGCEVLSLRNWEAPLSLSGCSCASLEMPALFCLSCFSLSLVETTPLHLLGVEL